MTACAPIQTTPNTAPAASAPSCPLAIHSRRAGDRRSGVPGSARGSSRMTVRRYGVGGGREARFARAAADLDTVMRQA